MVTMIPSPGFQVPRPKATTHMQPRAAFPGLNEEGEAASREAVLRTLGRVLQSTLFKHSVRLSQFLRFIVEQTLQGCGETLKEYRIATEVYGRGFDFDPAQDSIIRTEARRLRRKLEEYYELEGMHDDVVITLNPGSYVPVSRRRISVAKGWDPSTEAWNRSSGSDAEVEVVVKPFLSHSDNAPASILAFSLSDELLHRLMRIAGVRVVWHPFAEQHRSNLVSASPQITIDGTVRTVNSGLRITARVTRADGLILWSQQFDATSEADMPADFAELVAASIVTRLSPEGVIPQGHATRDFYLFYSEVLAAEALLEAGSIPAVSAALQRFDALAAWAPRHARPHTGVAQCCITLSQRGVGQSQEMQSRGKQACLAALDIDPRCSEAHAAMGCLQAQEWRWKDAEESFRTALCLGDRHATHRQFSQLLLVQQRMDEARIHLELADKMDQFSARQNLSKARFLYYSRWEASPHHGWPALLGPLSPEVSMLQALAEIQRGEQIKARLLAKEIQEKPAFAHPVYLACAAELVALCGRQDEGRCLVTNAGLLEWDAPISYFRKACLALSLQDLAGGLEFLQESLRQREPELPWMAVEPRFDWIRDDDEYLAILHAVFPGESGSHPAASSR